MTTGAPLGEDEKWMNRALELRKVRPVIDRVFAFDEGRINMSPSSCFALYEAFLLENPQHRKHGGIRQGRARKRSGSVSGTTQANRGTATEVICGAPRSAPMRRRR